MSDQVTVTLSTKERDKLIHLFENNLFPTDCLSGVARKAITTAIRNAVSTIQVTSWAEPDPDYGKRTATIAEGRLWIETEYDSFSIGIPEGLQIVKREP